MRRSAPRDRARRSPAERPAAQFANERACAARLAERRRAASRGVHRTHTPWRPASRQDLMDVKDCAASTEALIRLNAHPSREEIRYGTRRTGHRRHARHRRRDQQALKAAGRTVVASYAGNDAAAEAFTDETGIAVQQVRRRRLRRLRRPRWTQIEAEIGRDRDPGQQCRHHPRRHDEAQLTREMWDAVIDTNLGSCFNLCKLVWDGMRAAKFGRIVNIGSINGQAGQYGQVNYAAAKSGIHGFTKALAQEGARSAHHRQRDRAGLCRYRHGARGAARRAGEDHRAHPDAAGSGTRRGYRPRRGVPDRRRRRFHHRLDAVDQWRAAHVLTGAPGRRGDARRPGRGSLRRHRRAGRTMGYAIIAWDGPDPARRAAVRDKHLSVLTRWAQDGRLALGVPLFSADWQPAGSLMVLNVPDKAGLDAYLAEEPFAVDGVWARWEVHPFRIAPLPYRPLPQPGEPVPPRAPTP